MFTITSKLKRRNIEPKIYSAVITIQCPEGNFRRLCLGADYALEDFIKANQDQFASELALRFDTPIAEFRKSSNIQMEVYIAKTLDELSNGLVHEKIEEVETPIDPEAKVEFSKNALMKDILEHKNRFLYEKNLELFSEAEKKFIEEKLKDK